MNANLPAGKADKTKEIVKADVYYKNVKIYLDGAELIPTDVNGKYVEPFLMGGSTYLPLRAIASALGLEVGWDEKTNTITLDAPEEEAPTGMVWRLVKQTVTTTSDDNGSFGTPPGSINMVLETEYRYNESGRFLGLFVSLMDFRIADMDCAYDASGKLTTLSLLTSEQIVELYFGYDAAGRTNSISAYINGEFYADTSLSYDAKGRVASEISNNAVDNSRTTTVYTYDENGNCIRIVTDNSSLAAAVRAERCTVTMEYDSEGRIISEKCTLSGGINTFGEAVLYTICYSYDNNGNLIFYTYSDPDTSFSQSFEYDTQGREISSVLSYTLPDEETVRSSTEWSLDGLSCRVTTVNDYGDTTVESLVWNEEGLLLRSQQKFDGYSILTEYEYELMPYCSHNEFLDTVLALLGYSM